MQFQCYSSVQNKVITDRTTKIKKCLYSIYICLQVILELFGGNYSFDVVIPSSPQMRIENHNLRIGQKFTIIITATNSVGESDPFQSNFTVHNVTGK